MSLKVTSKAKKSEEEQPSQENALTQFSRRPAVGGTLSVAALYIAVRLGVSSFHHLRRHNLRFLLLAVCDSLDAVGASYWLDFGCLLGITRDKDLILYDNDVDLVVLNPNWVDLLPRLESILEPKYRLKVVTPSETLKGGGGNSHCKGGGGSSWLRAYCPLGMADIFAAYSDTANNAHKILIDCGHGDVMHIPSELVLPSSEMEWRGRKIKCPANVEGVLEWRYGKDWRTPKYMDKGADTVEGSKPYAKIFRALAKIGIRL